MGEGEGGVDAVDFFEVVGWEGDVGGGHFGWLWLEGLVLEVGVVSFSLLSFFAMGGRLEVKVCLVYWVIQIL